MNKISTKVWATASWQQPRNGRAMTLAHQSGRGDGVLATGVVEGEQRVSQAVEGLDGSRFTNSFRE
jgi:hypothetical protein